MTCFQRTHHGTYAKNQIHSLLATAGMPRRVKFLREEDVRLLGLVKEVFLDTAHSFIVHLSSAPLLALADDPRRGRRAPGGLFGDIAYCECDLTVIAQTHLIRYS